MFFVRFIIEGKHHGILFCRQNQMNCKDLTNCHPNDNRKGEKSSKISIKL